MWLVYCSIKGENCGPTGHKGITSATGWSTDTTEMALISELESVSLKPSILGHKCTTS